MTLQEFVAKCMTYGYNNKTERIIYVFEVGELPDDDIDEEIEGIKDTLSGEGGTILSLTIHGGRSASTPMQLIYVAITPLMVQAELQSLFVSLQEVGIQIPTAEAVKQTHRHISTTKHEQTARQTQSPQYQKIILSVSL